MIPDLPLRNGQETLQEPGVLSEGKYLILAKIREGGMGTIYRVRHRLLDEIRVIKVMRPHTASDPDLRRRFREEARIATRLKHPNICSIHDFAVDDGGRSYLVMEYVDGVNLADFMGSLGLPGVPLTLEIAHQTLLALGYLHRKGVVHRDVAPDNLMRTYDDDRRPVVKVIDLGIAKAVDRESDMTAAGVLLGKPRYSSPEQLGTLPPGERVDGRSDLYSLGVVLYELLTGQSPFEGKSTTDLLKARRLNSIIPLEESDVQGRVPPDLRAVVLKALERKREDRYATADEFDRAIVSLQRRYATLKPIEISPEMLETIRIEQPSSGAVTPGAQDRLDRQFADRRTPPPSPSPSSELSAVSPTSLPGDPLHTIRLPVEKRGLRPPGPPSLPSLDGVELMTGGSSGDVELPGPVPLPAPAAARERPPDRKRNAGARAPDMGTPLKQVPAHRAGRILPAAGFALAVIAMFFVWRSWPSRNAGTTATVAVAKSEPVAVATARVEPAAPTPAGAAPRSQAAPPEVGSSSAPLSTQETASTPGQASTLETSSTGAAEATPGPQSAPNPSPATGSSAALEPPAPAPAPTPGTSSSHEAVSAQPPSPAAPGVLRALAEKTAGARRNAEAVRGQDFAPSTYRRAVAKQASADKLRSSGSGSARQAEALYREASDLFDFAAAAGAQTRASAAPPQGATRPTGAAPAPVPAEGAPPETRAAEAEPPGAGAPPETGDARAETEDQAQSRQRIRQAIVDYAWARRTRNAGLLAQVFPSDRTRFAQDSKASSLPAVSLDVESIDFESENRAIVGAQELVVPADQPAGTTPDRAAIVLELERRGGRWFIVRRRTL